MGFRFKNTKGGDTMTCFMCKGTLEDKMTTFMLDLGNCIVIVKNVPSQVCSQCGEISYSNDVAKKLEKIINSARILSTEIIVFNYENNLAA